MIVCSCNVISDHDIKAAVAGSDDPLRHAKHVYGCLGRNVECGRCARNIKAIINETLGDCADACQAGCRHSRNRADTPLEDEEAEFALAAC
ncbi:MAG: (2Fe-2S)-binding protein [Bradyrhizobium sp.]|uniref:(2Fe-2S)-binding protein n=1 Tax=Bradyrhizobium sp. TaxID=376 RepID=UPI0025C38E78|nr:(2Fe-2S)-binding protein [Bradyrhizobium sp.]MBI5265465.1 (2Fe-2S)-binding protein [Bradyrhizobium sp.]